MRKGNAVDSRPTPDGLEEWWDKPVREFATLEPTVLSDWERERHRIYSLLVCSIVFGKWNGNKLGQVGNYGRWRESQVESRDLTFHEPGYAGHLYAGGTYEGHNICAIAVDAEGRIMDFDFNHNAVFDSTVEHAESRLVRRLFALNQIYAPWYVLDDDGDSTAPTVPQLTRTRQYRNVFATAVSDRPTPKEPTQASASDQASIEKPIEYNSLLKDVTIYTSLESCAQCSGIMCLASVKDIVYLQWDQGQFLIGNIMRNATLAQPLGFVSPRPIRGDDFGFEYFDLLNEGNDRFSEELASSPFYVAPNGTASPSAQKPSVTSYLCTDDAREVFRRADAELSGWTSAAHSGEPPGGGFTNQQVLDQARDFRAWVNQLTNRGAPHRV